MRFFPSFILILLIFSCLHAQQNGRFLLPSQTQKSKYATPYDSLAANWTSVPYASSYVGYSETYDIAVANALKGSRIGGDTLFISHYYFCLATMTEAEIDTLLDSYSRINNHIKNLTLLKRVDLEYFGSYSKGAYKTIDKKLNELNAFLEKVRMKKGSAVQSKFDRCAALKRELSGAFQGCTTLKSIQTQDSLYRRKVNRCIDTVMLDYSRPDNQGNYSYYDYDKRAPQALLDTIESLKTTRKNETIKAVRVFLSLNQNALRTYFTKTPEQAQITQQINAVNEKLKPYVTIFASNLLAHQGSTILVEGNMSLAGGLYYYEIFGAPQSVITSLSTPFTMAAIQGLSYVGTKQMVHNTMNITVKQYKVSPEANPYYASLKALQERQSIAYRSAFEKLKMQIQGYTLHDEKDRYSLTHLTNQLKELGWSEELVITP